MDLLIWIAAAILSLVDPTRGSDIKCGGATGVNCDVIDLIVVKALVGGFPCLPVIRASVKTSDVSSHVNIFGVEAKHVKAPTSSWSQRLPGRLRQSRSIRMSNTLRSLPRSTSSEHGRRARVDSRSPINCLFDIFLLDDTVLD